MGAIAGCFNRNLTLVEPETVETMLYPLQALGRDGGGTCYHNFVAMGMLENRYGKPSNTSLEPYQGDDGIIIIADSTLLDRSNLANCLGFDSDKDMSDSQLIHSAYRRWGKTCPEVLTGDFAFAIWDPRHQALFCVRDPMGARGFCYSPRERFLFASEIKGVIAGDSVLADNLNTQYLAEYMIDLRSTYEDSAFKDIHRLRPGHALWVTQKTVQQWSYWKPDFQPVEKQKASDYLEQSWDLLNTILKERSQYHDKIGIALGGGLNSSLLASAAVNTLDTPEQSLFAITHRLPPSYSGELNDEYTYAQAISDHLNIPLTAVYEQSPQISLGHELEEKFYALDDPSGNPFSGDYQTIYNTTKRSGVDLLMMGVDGDNLLTWDAYEHPLGFLQQGAVKQSLSALFSHGSSPSSNYLKRIFNHIVLPLTPDTLYNNIETLRVSLKGQARWEKSRLLHEHIIKGYSLREQREIYANSFQQQRLSSNPGVYRWGKIQRVLAIQHRHSAHQRQYGVATCWPFLDKRLINFCMSLPLDVFTLSGQRRGFARQLLSEKVPQNVSHRKNRTPFPADFKRRCSLAVPKVISTLKQLENTDPIWEFADRHAIDLAIERLKMQNTDSKYWRTLDLVSLVRVIVLRNFLYWHKKNPYKTNTSTGKLSILALK